MRLPGRTAVSSGLVALLVGATTLHAQSLSLRAGAGVAIPAGEAGERRDAAPAAMLAIESRLSTSWSLRLDGEWSMLEGPVAPAGEEHFGEYQDLRTVGVSLNAVLRLPAGAFSPYLLAGVGAYRLQRVDSPKSPYGTTGALQAGFGVDASLSPRISAFVEARAQIHITDYGVSDFGVTTICPLVVGGRAR